MRIVVSCLLFGIAVIAFVLSGRSYCERGFLLNNVYLYATESEKAAMNKRPYYRQSAVVFLFAGLIFLFNGLSVLLMNECLSYLAIVLMIAVVVYTIVSSNSIKKKIQ